MNELIETFTNQWNEKAKDTYDVYMSIPNVSPAFDDLWKEHGYIDDVVKLFQVWANDNAPKSAQTYVQRIEGKTPLLIVDIPALNYKDSDCILLYGHLDKQPPMEGWMDGIEPFQPTYVEDRIYGRGSADDGYALFSSLLACKYLEENNISHARMVIIIEACEESGSPDLPEHLEKLSSTLASELGDISLVICLDSGCLTYEHLWVTNSLRGLLQINCDIRVLDQGTHSGGAGGIVPSAFHVLRELLDRIVEPGTGKVILPELCVEVRQDTKSSAQNAAEILGSVDAHGLPFAKDVQPIHESLSDQIIANTYESQLEIIGIEGIPSIQDAGNVLRPNVKVALSFRLPPGINPAKAAAAVSGSLLKEVPFNARVSVVIDSMASGWEAPKLDVWLETSLRNASTSYFGQDAQFMGEGGSIPFMAMLGQKYPDAQFLVTGLLGPGSNAHGPNEFLHFPTAMKLTACVTDILIAHGSR